MKINHIDRELGNGSFGGATGQLKLEIKTRAADGTVVTREAESFKKFAEVYGLRALAAETGG
jgi:hypothetical protein